MTRTVGIKFQLKQTILIFRTKFNQKGCFRSKMEKLIATIEFCIFELVLVPNIILNWKCWYFGQNLLKKGISGWKRKSEHHHWILYVRISPGAKFQLKLTILIIWTKFTQKGYFRLKLEKMNITIELCIFEPSLGTKFQLKLAILIFWTKFTQKCYFRSKLEKINITIEFCLFELVFGYIIGFWYIGPNLPKKSISSLKQKSSIFACVHGRHLLY